MIAKPEGRAGEMVYELTAPPVEVTVIAVMAAPTIAVPELADKAIAGFASFVVRLRTAVALPDGLVPVIV